MDAGLVRLPSGMTWRKRGWLLVPILAVSFVIRAVYPDQPIVENYVGRQVPTAMVARNLERGCGLFAPQLDTAPFPNYFVVEPPLYELGAVLLRRASGLPLAAAGRTLSALASLLSGWGLFELVRRRQGDRVALWASSALGIFPLTIRYGRAFQPDALMLGTVLAGLACWDRFVTGKRSCWIAVGWCLLALGLALKVTSAALLVPLVVVIAPARRTRDILATCSTVLPVLFWYAWANFLVETGTGSRAAADNRAIWLGLGGPTALWKGQTISWVVRFLLVRAFTPLGAGLALVGLFHSHSRDATWRIWRIWGLSVMATMALLAGKLHHEYYWLILAPVVAVGIGQTLDRLAARYPAGAAALGAALVLVCWFGVRSTWRTPPEWSDLAAAARAVAQVVPREAWVASSEAMLYESDRRGCRMEWTEPAAQRAAGEWGGEHHVRCPLDLLAFYRLRGARFFADLGDGNAGHSRKVLHDAIRRRYKVIVDSPEVVIADLVDYEIPFHAKRGSAGHDP